MARADLLRRLFMGFQQGDQRVFREAAEQIIQEERKKHHVVLANELQRILETSDISGVFEGPRPYPAPPQDVDRRAALFEVRRAERYLSDLVLPAPIRDSVDRIAEEFREWEVLETNGLLPIRRVLFCGPSGCGKTATAEALASELSLPLLYVRFDAVVSSLLGETAANLRKVFDYVHRGRWVVLFDEFDAIGRSRDDSTEHGEIKRVVNSFLQILDGFNGRSVIIASTNFEQALDPAIWRRFDEVIRFERPTRAELYELISKLLTPVRHQRDIPAVLAERLVGGTFADAERVCLDIRKACALRGEMAIRWEDVELAVARHTYRQGVLQRAAHSFSPIVDTD